MTRKWSTDPRLTKSNSLKARLVPNKDVSPLQAEANHTVDGSLPRFLAHLHNRSDTGDQRTLCSHLRN